MKILLISLFMASALFGEELVGEVVSLDTSFLQKSLVPQEIELSLPLTQPQAYKSSVLAVGLSVIVPGLGHAYLGDMRTAGCLIGSSWAGMGLGYGLNSSNETKEFIRSTSLLTAQTTWFYGLYAAYRDVRKFNGPSNYSYKMPTDSFADLTAAPFNFRVMKKPEVWGGLIGSLAIAVGTAYLTFPKEAHISPALSIKRTLFPVTALPIGIGEESFFRGFLQSAFSEWLTPWGGVAVSSVLFGAAHIPNAWGLESHHRRNYYSVIVPLITLFGVYDGWLTLKNHSLKESVALHAWYDGILFAIGSMASQAAINGRMEMAVAFSF